MTIHCYSQRLLNPFRGVVNVIRYQWAEAVTTDGRRWDIYVSNDGLLEGLDTRRPVATSDIRYGSWSAKNGLKRGPIHPSDEFKMMEEMGAVVYEHLLKVHAQVPFPFADKYELWLLNAEGNPLALLHSVIDADEMQNDLSVNWRAGNACRDSFTPQWRETDTGRGGNAADCLGRHINKQAGHPPSAQWFERKSGGNGYGLDGINLDPEQMGRKLPHGAFPQLYVDDVNHDAGFRRLIRQFLDWQAPWLLLLPILDSKQRRHYEQQARRQALEVERLHSLYPEIVDESAIMAARVEAKLRSSQPVHESPEDVMSTFYIELNPGPTD